MNESTDSGEAPMSDTEYAQKMAENSAAKNALKEAKREFLAAIHKLQREDSDRFSTLVCEAALGIRHEDITNPFTLKSIHDFNMESPELTKEQIEAIELVCAHNEIVTGRVRDAAGVFLAALKRRENKKNEKEVLQPPRDYLTLADWITENGYVPEHVHPRHIYRPSPVDVIWDYFDFQEQWFAYSLWEACNLVDHGVPLYEQVGDGSRFQRINFESPDYIYLSKKGEHRDGEMTSRFPYWATKYFFKTSDLATHKIFFESVSSESSRATIEVLRNAYRRAIGVGESSRSDFDQGGAAHSTRLLGFMQRAIDRYYSKTFDPHDLDTCPSQEAVIKWLRQEFNISARQASAIDIITRPDGARGRR